ncbi:MAG: hypothetical protein WKF97_04920 [Chitinophagaceae bacterium]
MLIIILTWVCITLLVYPAGVLLHSLLQRLFGLETRHEHFAINCISGLFVTSFISTLLCLFIPLGLVSNLVSLVLASTGFFVNRRNIRASIRSDIKRLRRGHWIISLLVFSFLLIIAYLSYLPSSHYDDGLYYSTSIKWLQEFGTVKGLANINQRIGYNSSWHILQANFGFRYLNAGLFNDLNGLLFMWMLLYSAGGINNLVKGDNSVHNSVRALIIMPVLVFHFSASSEWILYNVNFLSSSSADIPACLITWLTFLLFTKDTNDNVHVLPLTDILVVLYSTWAFTIKLSVLPIALLCIYIVMRLIRLRQFPLSVLLCMLSLIYVLPWLSRNVFISGYLLFPFSAFDIFAVEWKLPVYEVKWHEDAIKVFAIGADIKSSFDIPFLQWFPTWFIKAKIIQQVILGMTLIATISYIVIFIRQLLLKNVLIIRSQAKIIFCLVTCFAGIVFWLNKAPDFRFGYSFLCFYNIYFIILTCRYFLKDYLHYLYLPVGIYMAAVIGFHYGDRWMSARVIFGKALAYRMPSNVEQQPLRGKLPMNIVSQEDSWNAPLPVANQYEYDNLHPGLIGQAMKQGFKANNKEIKTP